MSAEYVRLRLNCLPVVRRDAQGKKRQITHFKQKNRFLIVLSSPLDDTANIYPLLERIRC